MSLSLKSNLFRQDVINEGSPLWSSLETIVERDHVVIVSLLFLLLAGLMLRLVPSGRARVRASLLLFGISLLIMLSAVVLAVGGFVSAAKGVHWAGLLIGGMAIVNLLSVLFFDVALKAVRLTTPRILRDLLVGVGYIAVALVLMSRGGVSLSGIITTSAVITAVIGFALQDTFGNIMGGLAIQLEKTIRPGDWVRVDQQVGRVTEIRWRYTAIDTRNWDTVLIPNSVMVKSQVLIYGRRSGEPVNHRQTIFFNVDFRYAPTEVIAAVSQKLQADTIPGVASQPPPQCILMDFKDSYGQYAVRYWLTDLATDDPTDSQVRARVYYALKRRGIPLSIPASSIFMTEDNEKRRREKKKRELKQRHQTLGGIDLFQGLTEMERKQIARRLQAAPFSRGEALMRQGAVGEWLYIIVKGSAEVRIHSDDQQYKAVATLREGDFLGEMSLLTGARRSATVIALEDTDCLRLDKAAFQEVVNGRPEIAEYLAEVLAQRQTELQAAREGLDEESRRRAMNSKRQDLLSRIYEFFSLGPSGS